MIDKAKLQTALRSPKARKYGLRFLLAFLAIGVLGFLLLPPVVKLVLVDQLAEVLHRPVTINSVSLNPYARSFTLDGFSVEEPEGGKEFVGFDRLYMNLESASLFRFGLVLGEVRLENPRIKVARLADNRYNFSDLLDEFLAKPKNNDPIPAFSVSNIQIIGGAIEFDDRPVGKKHVLDDINLTVPFVSSMAYATESFVEPAFSAQVNGAPMQVNGRSKPFAESLDSAIVLNVTDLQLAKYFDYSPIKFPVKVQEGTLNTHVKLVFRQDKDEPSTLVLTGGLMLSDLKVDDLSGAPLLSLKKGELSINSADLLNQRFVISRVALDSPEIHARVSRQGDINWVEYFRKELLSSKAVAKSAKKAGAPAAPEWSLGEAQVLEGAVHWLDESHGKPFNASMEGIELEAKNLSSKAGELAEFDASWRLLAGEWLKVDHFSVKGGRIDLAKRKVSMKDVLAKGAQGLLRRTADGQIDWLQTPALRVVEASQRDVSVPWKLTVSKYVGEDISLRFEDMAVSPAATQTIDGLGFVAENLSTEPGSTAKLATRFKLNTKGEVAVDGTISPSPLAANLNLDVKTLELLPLQSYFEKKLNIAVTKGVVTVGGQLQLSQAASSKASASGKPAKTAKDDDSLGLSGGFTGQVTIGDFHAVDKINSADFLRWKSLFFGKVDARLGPDSLDIGEIALSDFFARVIVSPEGKLNLLQILRKDDAVPVAVVPASAEQGGKPALAAQNPGKVASADGKAVASVAAAGKSVMPVKVGKITLQGGSVRFTDNFVKPNYTANLRRIVGRVSGLSSDPGTLANLELRGAYDKVSPLNVKARINPLSAKPYLDLQADIRGIELTALSSYSGKYAGYLIEKGKLSLFVKYKIENNQLAAENRVFIDQLTFGDRVDSPDATSLPVSLAVALLKNRNGEIDLNLPISGSLDDPEFSIGSLVVKVIANLFIKAVTSPFALIGSMFGGGEELSNVEFDYGRVVITPEAEKRLDSLAKALIDRPSLSLEVEGRVDPEHDREGLKKARIDRKVRALKREDLTKSGIESESLSSIQVSEEEYPALLERVYKAEKFPKPRNMIGLVKTLPVEEMEKLIITNSVVDEEDLISLGDRRARAVRDWLVAKEVPVERVFLLPARLGEDDKSASEQKIKGSRVDFSLK